MKYLFSLNDAPCGSERGYHALRLARSLLNSAAEKVKVFLIGEVVACAKASQKVPLRYYNVGAMRDLLEARDVADRRS